MICAKCKGRRGHVEREPFCDERGYAVFRLVPCAACQATDDRVITQDSAGLSPLS